MDRLDAMALLVASVEEGSFSAAGRKLNIPLPTISRKIGDLEAHLKTRLLVRSTRKLALTEAGALYVNASKRVLELIDEAESQAAGEYMVPRGDLTISAPVVFGRLHIIPVVNDFLASFAEINVHMTLTDRNLNLVDDHIDMAVRIGDLPDSTLTATRVGAIRRVVCGSPSYFGAHGIPKTPEELVKHQCVTFSAMAAGQSWVFKPQGRKARLVRPLCRLHTNTAESAIESALASVGVTNVLSYQVAQAVCEKKLKVVLRDFEPPAMPVHIIHAHQGLLPLKMRRFLEFAAPRIRKSIQVSHKQAGYPPE
jgi:DNA-binding transcriptional LysR family regulator